MRIDSPRRSRAGAWVALGAGIVITMGVACSSDTHSGGPEKNSRDAGSDAANEGGRASNVGGTAGAVGAGGTAGAPSGGTTGSGGIAGSDAGEERDATPDRVVPSDATSDTSHPVDGRVPDGQSAAVDAAPAPDCRDVGCAAGEQCCYDGFQKATCTPSACNFPLTCARSSDCASTDVCCAHVFDFTTGSVSCDGSCTCASCLVHGSMDCAGPKDCPAGKICCGGDTVGSACVDTCGWYGPPSNGGVVCEDDGDCAAPKESCVAVAGFPRRRCRQPGWHSVACGTDTPCKTSTSHCCYDGATSTHFCAVSCGSPSIGWNCDEPEDCPTGEKCCAQATAASGREATLCATSCAGIGEVALEVFCSGQANCPEGTNCCLDAAGRTDCVVGPCPVHELCTSNTDCETGKHCVAVTDASLTAPTGAAWCEPL